MIRCLDMSIYGQPETRKEDHSVAGWRARARGEKPPRCVRCRCRLSQSRALVGSCWICTPKLFSK